MLNDIINESIVCLSVCLSMTFESLLLTLHSASMLQLVLLSVYKQQQQ